MEFLSSEWFAKVAELKAAAGPIELPKEIAETVINLTITDMGDGKQVHVAGGDFLDGHNDAAEVTLGLTSELMRKVFIEMDTQAGMQAFFAGEIKVDGDVSKIMALQTYQPDEKQKALLDQIIAMTA